jgi:predicted ATPase
MQPWEDPEFVDQITLMQKERQMNSTGNMQFYDRSPFYNYALGNFYSNPRMS